jgi:hypothetical protein
MEENSAVAYIERVGNKNGRQDNKQLLKISDLKQDKPFITLDTVHCLKLFDVEEVPGTDSISFCR